MAVNSDLLARELHELIAALDRRVPRVEQAGEASIARDAAALKAKALKRLTELADQNASEASFGQRPAETETTHEPSGTPASSSGESSGTGG